MVGLEEREVKQRVAILRRLREALNTQRQKFQKYLFVLEHEESDIINGEMDRLAAHVELEQSIVKEIGAVQKVIDPLADMYRMAYPQREEDIPEIMTSLESLKTQVLERNIKNQQLLRRQMTNLRSKILDLQSHKRAKSVFSANETPVLVDIST